MGRLANAVGALAVTKKGPMEGAPTQKELERVFEKNFEKERSLLLRRDKVDQSYIRRKAEEEGVPVVDFLLRKMKELEKVEGRPSTLFACPNSETVIKAALRSAKRANAPIKFAATLNQVDEDGGYTGLTQSEFVEMVKIEAEAISYEGLIIVALDHGGPWLKDQHSIENWSLEENHDSG